MTDIAFDARLAELRIAARGGSLRVGGIGPVSGPFHGFNLFDGHRADSPCIGYVCDRPASSRLDNDRLTPDQFDRLSRLVRKLATRQAVSA